jgi:zinc transport system substrate-binding protein
MVKGGSLKTCLACSLMLFLSIIILDSQLEFKVNATEGLNSSIQSPQSKTLKIYTSFYPIYDFVKKIGKDKIDVSTIVPAGIEPHDFEPSPKQIIDIQKSDAVFINGGSFESWLNKLRDVMIIDLSSNLNVGKTMQSSSTDPHTWLDPILVKVQAKHILDTLVKLDPQNKQYYSVNYNHFLNDLDKLNADIISNLTNCKLNDFVSFHNAFTYFSKRYGLNQHAINSIQSEGANIPPQKIREAIDTSKELGVNVIFAEDNIDPRLPELIAKEINGQVLTLSTLEIVTEKEQQMNADYFSKMYENLKNLRIALKC